jgi:PAS domain-containing protein
VGCALQPASRALVNLPPHLDTFTPLKDIHNHQQPWISLSSPCTTCRPVSPGPSVALIYQLLLTSLDATVLYCSDSIGDVLGHQPSDVIGKSCFEYFHPDETPFAKTAHARGVNLDRAAMLSYCNLKRTDGSYVRCECVFTVVYSVIVACTSLYQYTEKSAGPGPRPLSPKYPN